LSATPPAIRSLDSNRCLTKERSRRGLRSRSRCSSARFAWISKLLDAATGSVLDCKTSVAQEGRGRELGSPLKRLVPASPCCQSLVLEPALANQWLGGGLRSRSRGSNARRSAAPCAASECMRDFRASLVEEGRGRELGSPRGSSARITELPEAAKMLASRWYRPWEGLVTGPPGSHAPVFEPTFAEERLGGGLRSCSGVSSVRSILDPEGESRGSRRNASSLCGSTSPS
jgi:hypothetical protein